MHDPTRLGPSPRGYWSNSICLMNVILPLSFLPQAARRATRGAKASAAGMAGFDA